MLARQSVAPIVGLAGVCLLAAVAMGVHYRHDSRPGRVDSWLGSGGAEHLPLRRLLRGIVLLGDPAVVGLIAVVVALVLAVAIDLRALCLVLLGPVASGALNEFVAKPLVGRTLDGDLAFPSGHTIAATSLVTALVVIVLRYRGPRGSAVRTVLLAALCAVPAAVATCLVLLDLHYATDTVGALLGGVAVVLLVAAAIDVAGDRGHRRRPSPSGGLRLGPRGGS